MKVLITGGTGFIGSRLVQRCKQRGDDVVILSQTNTQAEKENAQQLESQGFGIVYGSVMDMDKVRQAVSGCDVVFHLAAAQHETNVPDQHFWDINVEGTRNVLEASIESGVRRFVHGSTIGVYGVEIQGEIDESSPLKPNNIYGITKKAGEELVLSYKDKLPVSVVRISEAYGPGDRRLLKLFKAIRNRKFFIIGDGENKHQLVYVDDLIDGLFALSERGQALGEVFVIAGSEILTTNDIVNTIADALQVRKPTVRMPMWLFHFLALLLEKTLQPLGIQPPLHRRRLDFFKKTLYFSLGKSSSLLGYQAKTSFRKGAGLTADWYKEHGFL